METPDIALNDSTHPLCFTAGAQVFHMPSQFIYDEKALPEPKVITHQYLDLLPKLPPGESCKFLLSAVPSYRCRDLQAEEPLDPSFISGCISPTGIREVQGEFDPLSYMWQGPVVLGNEIWPTREHVIVYWKLISSSFLDINKITPALKSLDTGFTAKKFGCENCEQEYLSLWQQVRESVVKEILLSAAFIDVNFVRCLLDPRITEFCHVLPRGHDNYWAYPG